METSFQSWKFAKGLYLIPLFMVFNESIILGGPIPLVVWNGFLAIIALTAFAACLEGYLFAPIVLWQRLIIVPGVIAVFWPDFLFEVVGVAVLLAVLTLNWARGRREQTEPPALVS